MRRSAAAENRTGLSELGVVAVGTAAAVALTAAAAEATTAAAAGKLLKELRAGL